MLYQEKSGNPGENPGSQLQLNRKNQLSRSHAYGRDLQP
jgi:hypothetical protein